jgi:hypothetical protein
MVVVKVGLKNKHLKIPKDFYLLGPDDILRKGDMCANIHEIKWVSIDSDDVGMNVWQDYAIRKRS